MDTNKIIHLAANAGKLMLKMAAKPIGLRKR